MSSDHITRALPAASKLTFGLARSGVQGEMVQVRSAPLRKSCQLEAVRADLARLSHSSAIRRSRVSTVPTRPLPDGADKLQRNLNNISVRSFILSGAPVKSISYWKPL
jgi:hypothetical protein